MAIEKVRPGDNIDSTGTAIGSGKISAVIQPLVDRLTAIAAATCEAPIALFSLIDENHQHIKSQIGLDNIPAITSEGSICSRIVDNHDISTLEDARNDARFRDCTLIADFGMCFYAGAPVSAHGSIVGVVCVMDSTPRQATKTLRATLAEIAQTIGSAIEIGDSTAYAMPVEQGVEKMMELVFRHTPAMLHSLDADGTLMDVSAAWLERLGYERSEVIGRPWAELMTPESAKFASETVIPNFFETGNHGDIEYQIVTKNGSLLDVTVSAVMQPAKRDRTARSIAILTDITDRRRVERALKENRDRLNRVIESSDIGTWEWNIQTGELRSNDKWLRLLGYRAGEIPMSCGTDATNITHPSDVERSYQQLEKHLSGEIEYYECENRLRHKLGHWVWVLDRARISAWDENGAPLWVSGTQTDISERKRVEIRAKETRTLLERTGAIASVGGWKFNTATGTFSLSSQALKILELAPGTKLIFDDFKTYFPPRSRVESIRAIKSCVVQGDSFVVELQMQTATQRAVWIRLSGKAETDEFQTLNVVGALQDISEQHEAEVELAKSRELLQVTLESIGEAVITTDIDGNIEWMNSVAESLLGWDSAEVMQRPIAEVLKSGTGNSDNSGARAVFECLETAETITANDCSILLSRIGKRIEIQQSAAPIVDNRGKTHRAVLVLRDVSEQQRLIEEVHYRASHDSLTGLINREEFEDRLDKLIKSSNDPDAEHALMYIDLDEFKIVNDSCGHPAGDELLKRISSVFKKCIRHRDVLARLGGDEFGVILEDCSMVQALKVAQKICDNVDDYRFFHEGQRHRIGTSIGLVPIDVDWENLSMVLKAADAACYAAKERGRNRVCVWDESDTTIVERQGEMRWTQQIESALEDDRFCLYAQRIDPIQTPKAGVRCELLLRMNRSDGTIVPPHAFLPAAERFHLASRIDQWVVNAAFQWVRDLGNKADAFDTISINLSGQSLTDEIFQKFLEDEFEKSDLDLTKFCFEITETAAITRLVEASKFISRMRHYGVKTALDDFGAGASSFGYLKSLPVDYLKIDGQFIRDINSEALDLATVKCFVEVAQAIGIETIAEFVENQEVHTTLKEIGVDYGQGYFLHRPSPTAELVDSLAHT